jgi:hypothetical protein
MTRAQAKWMRNDLPYGKYILKEGGYVLFNRGYRPLMHVAEDGTRTEMERGTWVRYVAQEWFYDDRNPPWRSKATLRRIVAEMEGPATGPAQVPQDSPATQDRRRCGGEPHTEYARGPAAPLGPRKGPAPASSDICIDCDGLGVYPSGHRCKSCKGTGKVGKGEGVPRSPLREPPQPPPGEDDLPFGGLLGVP